MFRLAKSGDKNRIVKEVKELADVMYTFSKYPLDLMPHSIIIKDFIRRGKVVVVDEGVDKMTAATDGVVLVINKNFWDKLSKEDKIFVLAHEAGHVLLKHVIRNKPFNELWNIAGDAVINSQLIDVDGVTAKSIDPVTRNTVAEIVSNNRDIFPSDSMVNRIVEDVKDPSKYGDEDIYMLLLSMARKKGKGDIGYGSKEVESSVGDYGKPTTLPDDVWKVGELSKEVGEEVGEGEIGDVVRRIEDVVNRAIGTARKMASTIRGGMSSGMEVNLEKCRPTKNWIDVLRDILSGIGESVVSTWLRPSRRNPNYPGYKFYGVEEVVLLIDVSGSIDSKTMGMFLYEINKLFYDLGISNVHVILWDTDIVYEGDVRDILSLKDMITEKYSGGGTIITSAVKRASEIGGLSKGLVVVTDGYISTINDAEPYIENCQAVYGGSVILSTGIIPEVFKNSGWEWAYLQPP